MAIITDYAPGAYMTHDMLHMRGGHQVAWLIDGVEIPNTNIASNLAAQIDPKDIDYLEVQRGSYTADVGDRTYGVFNVVPRTGFERDRQAELVLSAGNFLQTDDQLSLGDHSERSAYYVSLNANRSDYGLAPPIAAVHHDATNGVGGFASLLSTARPRTNSASSPNSAATSSRSPTTPTPTTSKTSSTTPAACATPSTRPTPSSSLSWLHTFNPSTVLQLSPFFHYNNADYHSNPSDTPTATTADRTSTYAGAQASITATIARNTLQAGLYSFAQHDNYLFGVLFNDGSGTLPINEPDTASGGVVEEFVSDNFKPTSWLTLIAGLRQARFQGQFTENYTDPRFGAALRIPRLNWVFRAFYGRFYQPPPLLTASGPVLAYAKANNTTLVPLHGERDEEHQFGVQIPFRGWLLDADTFKNRVNNFLDHSNIGDSSIYFPVTVDGALVRAWELTLRSPASLASARPTSPTPTRSPSSAATSPEASSALPSATPPATLASPTPPSTTTSATPSTSASTPPCPRTPSPPPTSTTAPASPTAHPTHHSLSKRISALQHHLRSRPRQVHHRKHLRLYHRNQRRQPPRPARQLPHLRRLPLQRSPPALRRTPLPLQVLSSLFLA